MLQPFGEAIWLSDGPMADVGGFQYPTRMAVIRLSSGGLFIWSPVALSPALQAAVDALGEVRFLIAPNSLHHLFLDEWKRAYPNARLYAPPLSPRFPDCSRNDAHIGFTVFGFITIVMAGLPSYAR